MEGSNHISNTDLSIRVRNALLRHGCDTVEKLILHYEKGNLLNIRNFGEKSLEEVKNFILDKDNLTYLGVNEEEKLLNQEISNFSYNEYSSFRNLSDEKRLELTISNIESLLLLVSHLIKKSVLDRDILVNIDNEMINEIYDSLVRKVIKEKQNDKIYISDLYISKSLKIRFLLSNFGTLEEMIDYFISPNDPYEIKNEIKQIFDYTIFELTRLGKRDIQEKSWYKKILIQVDKTISWINEHNINTSIHIKKSNISKYFNETNLLKDTINNILENRNVLEYFSRNSLKNEINRITERLNEREKYMIISHYGIQKHSLEEIAIKEGVTRERVRQIESKAAEKIRLTIKYNFDDFLYLNIFLQQAMKMKNKYSYLSLINMFCLDTSAKLGFIEEIYQSDFSLEANILPAILYLGKNYFPNNLQDIAKQIYDSSNYPKIEKTAYQLCRNKSLVKNIYKKIRNSGAIHENDNLLSGLDQEIVNQVLNQLGLSRINEGWFTKKAYFSNGEFQQNESILNNTLRILKACPKAQISEVRHGIKNPLTRLDSQPVPLEVFIEVLLLNEFTIQDGYLSWEKDNNLILGNRDKYFLELVKEQGPVVTFDEICLKFQENELSRASAIGCTQWSPIVYRIGQGLYKLCGSIISPQDYTDAEERKQRVSLEFEYQYSPNGEIIFEINIGGWADGGTISIYKLPDIQGNWQYKLNDQIIEIKANEDFLYGFLPIFEHLGIKKTDRAIFKLNTWDRTITVEKISE